MGMPVEYPELTEYSIIDEFRAAPVEELPRSGISISISSKPTLADTAKTKAEEASIAKTISSKLKAMLLTAAILTTATAVVGEAAPPLEQAELTVATQYDFFSPPLENQSIFNEFFNQGGSIELSIDGENWEKLEVSQNSTDVFISYCGSEIDSGFEDWEGTRDYLPVIGEQGYRIRFDYPYGDMYYTCSFRGSPSDRDSVIIPGVSYIIPSGTEEIALFKRGADSVCQIDCSFVSPEQFGEDAYAEHGRLEIVYAEPILGDFDGIVYCENSENGCSAGVKPFSAVTVKAYPDEGYRLRCGLVNGRELAADENNEFVLHSNFFPIHLSAIFEPE